MKFCPSIYWKSRKKIVVANSIFLWPYNWPFDWPFWCDFFIDGVVFHEELGNAKKPKPKCVRVLSIPKMLLIHLPIAIRGWIRKCVWSFLWTWTIFLPECRWCSPHKQRLQEPLCRLPWPSKCSSRTAPSAQRQDRSWLSLIIQLGQRSAETVQVGYPRLCRGQFVHWECWGHLHPLP